MNISALVIHPHAARLLEQFLHAPTHAVLLTGNKGIGKTLIARQLALGLLGVESLENQPYFREMEAVKGTITIEQIRELIGFFRLKVPGRTAVQRVAVIPDADQMGLEAQNALLKLLEEPPAGSILLLTSSHAERLLPTIRSRVRMVALPTPGGEQLETFFAPQGHASAAVRAAILRHGDNLAAIAAELNGGTADETLGLVKQALGGSNYERLLLVDGLAKNRQAALDFTDTLAAVASASLEAAAGKGGQNIARWRSVLEVADTAQNALALNGNAKLVLTELMLAL